MQVLNVITRNKTDLKNINGYRLTMRVSISINLEFVVSRA